MIEKLKSYIEVDANQINQYSIVKSVCFLFAGALLSFILANWSFDKSLIIPVLSFILSTGIGILIEVSHQRKRKSIPSNLFEGYKNAEELEETKKELKRKNILANQISNAIQSLNNNTCPIDGNSDQKVCHEDLGKGLREILDNYISNPQYFLGIVESKFTVGAYVRYERFINHEDKELDWKERIFIFRDDLNFQMIMPENMNQISESSGDQVRIQSAIFESMKDFSYSIKKIDINQKSHSFLSFPIPNVCEECPVDGSVFLITECEAETPKDSIQVLPIYSKLISNWFSKYSDCIEKDFKEMYPEVYKNRHEHIVEEHQQITSDDDVR